ncbi:MAG: SufD family Fe-S cluster assembly protein [Erysipelotrichaceae bacterium]|nr:SufD family Fe-S cluster assembly protein [Erysipelotrichaceae bacterium]
MPKKIIEDEREVLIDSSMTVILKNDKINLKYDLKDGDYKILIYNDHKGDLVLSDSGQIVNSSVQINYLQLDAYDLKQESKVFVEKGSSLNVNSTYLGTGKKDVIYDLYNNGSDSSIDIYNNIVCLDGADFSMDCIGTIIKGAKRSKCHQSTHCLTIDSPKRARVLPVLNIDENDVEASHSLASGTIDEEILFYMNSRGLDKKEALNLILKSYLMPSDDYYEAFEDGRQIQESAIAKVDQICSM